MGNSNDVIQKILRENKELLSLPQTLAEVLRLTKDETSSVQELGQVLMRDPALTAKILRIANSPFYGVGREITTMTQAVVTLGLRTVTALTLSSSVYNLVDGWNSAIDRNRFWRHSLEVAIGSRLIYEGINRQQSEEAFIAGLLHDIGILVLERSFPKEYAEVWRKAQLDGASLVDLEEQTWGTNHAKVGKFLLEQWHLPQRITDAVGLHHMTFPPDERNPELVLGQTVALANFASRFPIGIGTKKDFSATAENRIGIMHNLNLPPEKFATIQSQLFQKTIEQAKYLEMEIGSVEELLMEGNRLLFEQYMTVENLLRENRQMQQQIAKDQMKKLALESLKTITATFNHYMNNATATILGRAQLVEYGIAKGQIVDPTGSLTTAMQIITNGVTTISAVMEELKNLAAFETTVYHAETYIIDIEAKLKKQLTKLEELAPNETVAP
ncbi:MAG: HDOD domain-containing protein [Candidatus Zixiibacteriota bacterium]